jgi:hypothetical protein
MERVRFILAGQTWISSDTNHNDGLQHGHCEQANPPKVLTVVVAHHLVATILPVAPVAPQQEQR